MSFIDEADLRDRVQLIRELHKKEVLNDLSICTHCHELCHSYEGLQCDVPIDGMWPCDTIKALDGTL